MFKILKIIFFGIKDIIRIKKTNNKKYTAKERIEMCESCEDLKPGTIERSVSCGLSPSKIESKTGLLMPSKSDLVDCIFNEQEGYKR